jgi:chemotaxis protein MotB
MSSRVRRRGSLDIWPGFVDALAALLMVLIFVLLIFTLSQFFLTDALSGRDRALAQLNSQIAELAELLSLEQGDNQRLQGLVAELQAGLTQANSENQRLTADFSAASKMVEEQGQTIETQLAELSKLHGDIEALRNVRSELEAEVAALARDLTGSRREAAMQAELSDQQQAQLVLLNRQIQALQEQLSAVSSALELAQSTVRNQKLELEDLGKRLNLALASKVQQLANYRSEFFGRLKEVLGDNPDLRVEGDRFVFQSELLFATGSADLGDQGRAQVRTLANTLLEISQAIPADIDWVLRVDGHTDRRPISSPLFPSNWELSTDRALAIVKHMISLGVDPQRLAATGFGEFHPLDDRENELAYARNRRIELKLTSR